jgi:hypothetical protein
MKAVKNESQEVRDSALIAICEQLFSSELAFAKKTLS